MTTEKRNFIAIKRKVDKTIGAATHKEIINFVRANPPKLWAAIKPRNILERNVTLTLYKDIKGIGYKKLHNIADIGFTWTHKCLNHNIQVLRKVIAKWAETKIKLGFEEEWNVAARHVSTDSILKSPNLWIDSSDWALQKWKGCSKKRSYWSYKLNKPGRRYMFIQDGKTRIRFLSNGYSPKVYDGTWLEIQKDWLEKHLKNGRILGDQHFEIGQKLIKSITFITPIKKKPRKRKCGQEQIESLTKEQQRWNDAVKDARARVETPFGIFQMYFKSLTKPWTEDEDQLDYLIKIAAGVHNSRIN